MENHTGALIGAHDRLSKRVLGNWLWWCLPPPPKRNTVFADLIEETPKGVKWHSAAATRKLLRMMSPVNLAKVTAAKKTGRRSVGTIYKRTRCDRNGVKEQRAEIRFDDIAGCLRTPVGGSSRQTIMIVEGSKVRSRLLSPREAGRLMGLPENYELPENYCRPTRPAALLPPDETRPVSLVRIARAAPTGGHFPATSSHKRSDPAYLPSGTPFRVWAYVVTPKVHSCPELGSHFYEKTRKSEPTPLTKRHPRYQLQLSVGHYRSRGR